MTHVNCGGQTKTVQSDREYRVEIAIDVTAQSPVEAARQAWALLTAPDAMLPVCEVLEMDSDDDPATVDLEEESYGRT